MAPLDPATISFAHRLADTAGEIIRPYFRQRIEVIDKGETTFDPVTAADRGAEEALRALIKHEYPDDAILGEEYGREPGTSGRVWILDPIDGTRAFITGRHSWGTLIALEEDGRRILGLIDQPVLRERFVGHSGTTEHMSPAGRQRLNTRACRSLSQAAVSTTHPWGYFDAAQRDAFEVLARQARMSYFGGDCYAYALLAMGHVDLIVEASLKPWDIAALVPIVENAGGVITDWQGKALGPGGHVVAAGDARVHAEAVKMLEGAA